MPGRTDFYSENGSKISRNNINYFDVTTFIFATHNANKVKEIRSLLGNDYQVISLEEAGFTDDIPEPYDTLEENAHEKSRIIYQATGKNCFSEDTGLEVEALAGAPGVFSARYAGPDKSAEANISKLLADMQDESNRRARFRTIISLILDGKEYQFEGCCPGRIARAPAGEKGFGYDPVFIPDGAERTFAQMDLAEKNLYSHRSRALIKLLEFLNMQKKQPGILWPE